MTEPRTREHETRRLEAQAEHPHDKLPTYQELLDEAVDETFPASDPISPTAAMNADRPVKTGMDHSDWHLVPSDAVSPHGERIVAAFEDEAAARRAQDEVLASELPTARLDLPAQGEAPAARLTVVACSPPQRDRAIEIVRRAGASQVEVGPASGG